MLKSVSMNKHIKGQDSDRGDSASKVLVFFVFLILTSSWTTKSHLYATSTDTKCEAGYKEQRKLINYTVIITQCVDVNECRKNKTICSPNASCSNTIGSYTCTCHPGYAKLNPSSRMCTDIDECKSGENLNGGICGSIGHCTNTDGSFRCQCPPGHTNYGNERTPCS
ncbi:hypothetical protein CRUP_011511, partial [Coryphaenoides rupestris]